MYNHGPTSVPNITFASKIHIFWFAWCCITNSSSCLSQEFLALETQCFHVWALVSFKKMIIHVPYKQIQLALAPHDIYKQSKSMWWHPQEGKTTSFDMIPYSHISTSWGTKAKMERTNIPYEIRIQIFKPTALVSGRTYFTFSA